MKVFKSSQVIKVAQLLISKAISIKDSWLDKTWFNPSFLKQ